MYYYTYEIFIDNPESELNGCFYYGKHTTKNLNDNYTGSGKLIKEYRKKFGTRGLKKTILQFADSLEELNQMEYDLVNLKFNELGKELCLNKGDGGAGRGKWLKYSTEEEYQEFCRKTTNGVYAKTTSKFRHQNAVNAGNSKKSVPEERKKEWTKNYKKSYENMTEEDKIKKYEKVSKSVKRFYDDVSNKDKIELMKQRNREANKKSAKIWRTGFFDVFGHTPEYFRKFSKMKDSIKLLYHKIEKFAKEDKEIEVNRFMESITE